MMTLLGSKVGFLKDSLDAKVQFLALAFDLGINTETDLYWYSDDAFSGISTDGEAFVQLLNEQAAKEAVVAVADAMIASAPRVGTSEGSVPLGCGYYGGFHNSTEERRKRQFPLSGRDRRRQPHQY